MGNERKPPLRFVSKYQQVEIASLKTGRRGKHHALVQGIVKELVTLKSGSALRIPLNEVGGIGLANLRSAVHRAAASGKLSIQTVADDENFYVWRAEKDVRG
jgi:hypothetical protein